MQSLQQVTRESSPNEKSEKVSMFGSQNITVFDCIAVTVVSFDVGRDISYDTLMPYT